MNSITFSCKVTNNSDHNDIALEFWLDNIKFYDNVILPGFHLITYNFEEDNNDHSIKIVMKNKTADHTVVSDSGEIISDTLLQINQIEFDEINIDQLFWENSTYSHNFNGYGDTVTEDFFGPMGCNGIVEFRFTTPFYIWLLEHM